MNAFRVKHRRFAAMLALAMMICSGVGLAQKYTTTKLNTLSEHTYADV